MYKLFIKYFSGKDTETQLSEKQLRIILKKGSKRPVRWAKVTTPSGTTKDVTNILMK